MRPGTAAHGDQARRVPQQGGYVSHRQGSGDHFPGGEPGGVIGISYVSESPHPQASRRRNPGDAFAPGGDHPVHPDIPAGHPYPTHGGPPTERLMQAVGVEVPDPAGMGNHSGCDQRMSQLAQIAQETGGDLRVDRGAPGNQFPKRRGVARPERRPDPLHIARGDGTAPTLCFQKDRASLNFLDQGGDGPAGRAGRSRAEAVEADRPRPHQFFSHRAGVSNHHADHIGHPGLCAVGRIGRRVGEPMDPCVNFRLSLNQI